MSGYIFTLDGAAVTWRSSKQTLITCSTMKVELIALEEATKEVEWLRSLPLDIPLIEKPILAISIHCDSQAAITRAHNKKHNAKTSRFI